MGKRIVAVLSGCALACALCAAMGLRVDLMLEGVVCFQRATDPDGEGMARVSCRDGRAWHVATQLSCSETLACTVGLDCVDRVEPVR